jgi:hypothetical protein
MLWYGPKTFLSQNIDKKYGTKMRNEGQSGQSLLRVVIQHTEDGPFWLSLSAPPSFSFFFFSLYPRFEVNKISSDNTAFFSF